MAIARAIVIEPPLVLMDEPLSNLDAKLRIETRAEIRRIHKELGRSTIYVTHDQDEALSLADRIVVMKDGVVQMIAAPHDVYGQPSNLHVARFMGYRNVLELNVDSEQGDRVTVSGPDVRLTGVRKQPLAGGRACVAMRPEGSCSPLPAAPIPLPGGSPTSNTAGAIRLSTWSPRRGRCCTCARQDAGPGRHRSRAGSVERVLVYPRGIRVSSAAAGAPPSAAFDRALLLVVPAAAFMLLLFVYPFLYGLALSFNPKEGGAFANYSHFFTTDNLWPTIWTTLRLALPATLINVGLALPIAFKMRVKSPYQRWATTILVIPITLAPCHRPGHADAFRTEGMLSQFLQFFHLYEGSIRLTHNYWGVLISLVISVPSRSCRSCPISPGSTRCWRVRRPRSARARARSSAPHPPLLAPGLAACFASRSYSVLGVSVRGAADRLQANAVIRRRIRGGIEQYDYSLASAIAMIMGFVQLIVVAAVLGLRNSLRIAVR